MSNSLFTQIDAEDSAVRPTNARRAKTCAHCGEGMPVTGVVFLHDGRPFCCAGCKTVYRILNEGLRESAGGEQAYAYLDDESFRRAYEGDDTMAFYLEGIHCASCIWAVEKISDLVPDVEHASLDVSRSVAEIRLRQGGRFAGAAAALEDMGFRPHPVKDGEAERLQQRENRRYLMRIGVAAVSMFNIMLFAIGVYSGADGVWATMFNWASFAFFLPIILYSAQPFFASAWGALRRGRASIDVPVALGLAVGTGLGIAHLAGAAEGDALYFDSLAALVFLLLGARYLVRRTQQRALQGAQLVSQLLPHQCRKWSPVSLTYEEATVEMLRIGDRIEVRAGEIVPVDGKVHTGTSELNTAVITGESAPAKVGEGSLALAGSQNLWGKLEIKVEASGAATKLGEMLETVQHAAEHRTQIGDMADRWAGWFTGAVLVLGASIFAYWVRVDVEAAFSNTLALFIVACPCALGLSVPLATVISMRRAAVRGMVIKRADVFERTARAEEVFLDKTGTVSHGSLAVLQWNLIDSAVDPTQVAQAVYALEEKSNHPVAKGLLAWLSARGVRPSENARDVVERLGEGVSGTIYGERFEVKRLDGSDVQGAPSNQTTVGIFRNGWQIGSVCLGDQLRADASAAIANLGALGLGVHLVSGDSEAAVSAAAATLGVSPDRVRAGCLPGDKLALVRSRQRAIMVGDGANDAAALQAAYVGVAVQGGMDVSLRAADVYFVTPGVQNVASLVKAARQTVSVIRRNFAFSLFYNIGGATLAALGLMSPLVAAVLMPISSATILVSSLIGAKEFR